jgi:hypothetical protein
MLPLSCKSSNTINAEVLTSFFFATVSSAYTQARSYSIFNYLATVSSVYHIEVEFTDDSVAIIVKVTT